MEKGLPDGGPLVRWGRSALLVRLAVRIALQDIKTLDLWVYSILWDTFCQGRGNAKLSNGTHLEGFAADFSLRDKRWNADTAHRALQALREAGFAAVLRYEGELGPKSPAHIHAALIPHSNSRAILRADKGRTLQSEVGRVFPQLSLEGRA